jgi:hypothetical protein
MGSETGNARLRNLKRDDDEQRIDERVFEASNAEDGELDPMESGQSSPGRRLMMVIAGEQEQSGSGGY